MANLLVAQLLYLDSVDLKRDITMYVNSPGGSVTAGEEGPGGAAVETVVKRRGELNWTGDRIVVSFVLPYPPSPTPSLWENSTTMLSPRQST